MAKLHLRYTCLLMLAACTGGQGGPGDDQVVVTASDQDGDTIIDLHEGYIDPEAPREEETEDTDTDVGDTDTPAEPEESRDTDGDGTPDYLDLESDGDGIPDADEAGDDDEVDDDKNTDQDEDDEQHEDDWVAEDGDNDSYYNKLIR